MINYLNYLELNNRIVHYKDFEDLKPQYFNISYQRQFLEKYLKIMVFYLL